MNDYNSKMATVKEAMGCPNCGRPLSAGALAGLCPACLLAQGGDTDASGRGGGARLQTLPVEEVGKLFPQLEILGLLGAGGMGAVYKARQPALDRIVALKILPATGAGGVNFEERFNREARALARLSHPNIVAVHEFGQVGGLHYFLMEFVDGANLRQLEKAGRLAPRETLQLIPQICDALQYAHDEGVVHRDIKPENVLVDRKGRVKIADFGLAKILGHDPGSLRLTAEGQIMGTPHYMAPEQVERPLTVDHRADIYSLGVVLYEMLTGDLPLGKFSPPSRKVQVDVRFDEVVLRALENDPARRYQQASEVKSQVETIAGTPASTPATKPAGAAEGSGRAEKHYRYWAGIPVVVVRDGKAEVSWNGLLSAVALVMGVLFVGFMLVWAITGHALSGGATLRVSLLAAGWILVLGVRRLIQQEHAPAVLPRTPEGTVILARRRWRPGREHFALAAMLGLVIGFGCFEVFRLRQRGAIASSESTAQVATLDRKTRALVAKLPGRSMVELLALSDFGAARDGWWHPDGTPVTNLTWGVGSLGNITAPNTRMKNLILRTKDLPYDALNPTVEFEHSAGHISGGKVDLNGQLLPDAWPFRVAFLETAHQTTMRMGFTIKPWSTIVAQRADPLGGWQLWSWAVAGDPRWTARITGEPTEVNGQAQIGYYFGPADRLWTHRIVAVDTDDLEHVSFRKSVTPVEKMEFFSAAFRELPLAAVKEFRLQVRPVHWVEFRNVALQAMGSGQPAVAASTESWSPAAAPGENPDPNKVLEEAGELMGRGEFEQALQRQIWYHNHAAEIQPSLSAVRRSFGLSAWLELSRRYPKAKQALIETRDNKARELAEGRGHSDLFADVVSINYYLQEEAATSALFKRIHQVDPGLARQCVHYAKEALVKNREYQLCLDYLPDVPAQFDRVRQQWNQEKARAGTQQDAQQFTRLADQRFVKNTRQWMEILNGVGRKAEAESIRVQAAAMVDDPQLHAGGAEEPATIGK